MSGPRRARDRDGNTTSNAHRRLEGDTPERISESGHIIPRRLISGASTSSFYGPARTCTPSPAENSRMWLPGETIDCHSGMRATNSGFQYQSTESDIERQKEWIHQLVSDMQATVLGRISDIDERIQSLSVRVSKLEDDVAHSSSNESTTTGVSQQSHSGIRIRKTPAEIQSRIREVYRNLGEDKQFRLDEEIDSEHNSKVVKLVAAEFDSPLV